MRYTGTSPRHLRLVANNGSLGGPRGFRLHLTGEDIRKIMRPRRRFNASRLIGNLALTLATVGCVLVLAWVAVTWISG